MTEQEQALAKASEAFIKAVKTGLTIGHVARVVTQAAETEFRLSVLTKKGITFQEFIESLSYSPRGGDANDV